jgi:hypothetical protein
MSRTSTFIHKMAARRQHREFERALRSASPEMEQDLRAVAAHQQYGAMQTRHHML